MATDDGSKTVVDGIDVTEEKDGGVIKVIKKEGIGNAYPSTGNTVFVHYVGTLENGDKFDSSRDRGEEFSFTIGRGQVIKAWDAGVASMSQGEIAVFTCQPQYAYGESGSPPKIPPDATLIFEVELIRWEGEDISPDHDKTITRSEQVKGEMYSNPNEGAQVTIHALGTHSGQVFIDKEVSFILGEAIEAGLPDGLDAALKRFNKGERSLLHLATKWGYRKLAPPEFKLPEDIPLDFDVTLKDFEKSKESWEMNSEEKIEAAEKFKIRGTTFFQEGKLKLAIGKYKKIVDLLEYEKNLEAEVKEKRDQLYIAAHLNLGLCFLKKKEAFESIKHCDKVIELDDSNVKALYRRAQGREMVKDYDIAAKDYEKVLTLEPDNKAAKAQLFICHKQLNKYKDEEKKRYKNMFSKMAAEDIKGETLSDEAKRSNAFPNSKPDTETNGVVPDATEVTKPEIVETNISQ